MGYTIIAIWVFLVCNSILIAMVAHRRGYKCAIRDVYNKRGEGADVYDTIYTFSRIESESEIRKAILHANTKENPQADTK